MKRLLPIALALAGLGTALFGLPHPRDARRAPAPNTTAPMAAAPAAPLATAPLAAASPWPCRPCAAPPPPRPPSWPRPTPHAPRTTERLTAAQRQAQQEAREQLERERAAKAQRVARYGYDVPEDGEREEHHDARERAEEQGRRLRRAGPVHGSRAGIRARIGGQPEYGAGYRVEAAQALDDTPASRAAKAMSQTPGAMAAQGIVAITEVGPGNVSGRTRVISPDPASPLDTWLVAGVDGGFWKTSNAGTSWTHVAANLDYLAFASIARSPRDPNVLYAGTGEGFGNSDAVRGDGIFRSSDRGNTWTLLASTNRFNGFSHTNRLVVFGTTQDTIVAATNVGIYRSVDNGTSWQQVYGENGRAASREIQQVISNPNCGPGRCSTRPSTSLTGAWCARATAARTGRASRSRDSEAGSRYEIALAPSDTTHLYAQIEASSTTTAYYRSADARASRGQAPERGVDQRAQRTGLVRQRPHR